MTPQRRTALVSVGAALALVSLKLGVGLASGSLGLVSEALHSGTDLVAALLTFFAIGVAGRPADAGHQYGHGKAEHLAALAEATVLALVSVAVVGLALARLGGAVEQEVETAWWVFAAVAVVLALDVSRTLVSYRAARRYKSEALLSNALHFGSDFVGTLAVLGGLVLAATGHPQGDSIAALFVAALVLAAAGRLIRRNVDVLMDRAPAAADGAVRQAIAGVEPPVELSRLRLRQAGGATFADVVIAVSPAEAVAQGHALADRVEAAVERVLPGSDVVVHVEPRNDHAALRERAHAAALSVPRVREIHNLSLVTHDGVTELSLHLKLPGELSLEDAHQLAEEVERAICAAVPEIASVQTHLEPLAEASPAVELDHGEVERIVRTVAGGAPREVRVLRTDEGLVAFLTLGLDPGSTLADRVEAAVERVLPGSDVVVHVEPRDDHAALRERAHAAALSVPRVREIHNLSLVTHDGVTELSLHLKLPGELPLEDAHQLAEEVERAICAAVPEIASVQTHLEPLAEASPAVELDHGEVERIVRTVAGGDPREVRVLRTDEGLVAFLTLGLDPGSTLADAHARASEVEDRLREEYPEIADVIVHTEP